jgi:glutamate decarboxylase
MDCGPSANKKKPTDVGISVQDLGTSATIGSFEACMFGGLAHKWNWREAGKDSSRPNMVTDGNVQIVWKKFMRYFDVEPRIVSLKPGNYRLTALEKVRPIFGQIATAK